MNSSKLKGLRVEKGKTQEEMAKSIEKSLDSYAKKERGEVIFLPDEIAIISNLLEMTFEQVNDIFFDGKLLNSNSKA